MTHSSGGGGGGSKTYPLLEREGSPSVTFRYCWIKVMEIEFWDGALSIVESMGTRKVK